MYLGQQLGRGQPQSNAFREVHRRGLAVLLPCVDRERLEEVLKLVLLHADSGVGYHHFEQVFFSDATNF